MSKNVFKEGTVCYVNVSSRSPQAHLFGMHVVLLKEYIDPSGTGMKAWRTEPQLLSPDGKMVYPALYEWALAPVAQPTAEDVKDVLEVLAMYNNKAFSTLLTLAKKIPGADDKKGPAK